MRRSRNVKIVATLGPASRDTSMIRKLFEAGVDVFRINMSHTRREDLPDLVGRIRRVEAEAGRPIGVLADLQGPKLRVGALQGGAAELRPGAQVVFDMEDAPGDGARVPLPHKEIYAAARPGHVLLLDDGKLRVRVTAAAPDRLTAAVEEGGVLRDRKGVNVPGAVLPIAALSPKDRSDLAAALEAHVDWVALSFVQRPEDVAEARKLVAGRAGVLAKIEKPSAIDRIEQIIELSDALMVARGDLGVELPLEQVPGKQKLITRCARAAGKPVVVATQMLESMISSPVPTRAEVSDVATAVFEGADAVMLSAETASGAHPVEAVSVMDRVAQSVEGDRYYRGIVDAQRGSPEPTIADAIMVAARQICETLRAAVIVSWTSSGSTALRAARERPGVPIIALTPIPATARRLALAWGLHCVRVDDAVDLDDVVDRACKIAFQEGFAAAGQRVVITCGVPLRTPGATNLLRVAFVGRRPGALD